MKKQLCCLGLALFVCSTGWSDPDPSGKVKNVKAEDTKENGVDALKKAVQGAEPGQKAPEAKEEPKGAVEKTGEKLNRLGSDLNAVLRWLQILEIDTDKTKSDILEKIKSIVEQFEEIVKDHQIASFFGPENIARIKDLTQQLRQKNKDALGAAIIVKENREKIGEIYRGVNKNIQEFTSKAIELAEKNLS